MVDQRRRVVRHIRQYDVAKHSQRNVEVIDMKEGS